MRRRGAGVAAIKNKNLAQVRPIPTTQNIIFYALQNVAQIRIVAPFGYIVFFFKI